jgi:hypothetical protein
MPNAITSNAITEPTTNDLIERGTRMTNLIQKSTNGYAMIYLEGDLPEQSSITIWCPPNLTKYGADGLQTFRSQLITALDRGLQNYAKGAGISRG